VHGWVYGLNNGLIEDLRMTVNIDSDAAAVYQRALATVRARHSAAAPD
jgi:carbonic anhydrase